MNEKLTPQERLKNAGEYRRVFDWGAYYRTPALQVHCRSSERELSRLGLVVSKKRGNSPVRTRIKRLLRDVYRRNKHQLPGIMDVVLVPRGHGAQDRSDYEKSFLRFVQMLCDGVEPVARGNRSGGRRKRPAKRRRAAKT